MEIQIAHRNHTLIPLLTACSGGWPVADLVVGYGIVSQLTVALSLHIIKCIRAHETGNHFRCTLVALSSRSCRLRTNDHPPCSTNSCPNFIAFFFGDFHSM